MAIYGSAVSSTVDTVKEAEEYFSHNPQDDKISIVLLNPDQTKQAEEGYEITGIVDVLKVIKNTKKKEMGLIAGYKPNLISKYLVLHMSGRNDEMISQMWKDMEKYKEDE